MLLVTSSQLHLNYLPCDLTHILCRDYNLGIIGMIDITYMIQSSNILCIVPYLHHAVK